MLLPGRVPGYNRTDIKLLPSSVTIWKEYIQAMIECDQRGGSYRTFCRRWNELLPSLVDLCWTCQQQGEAASLQEKSAALTAYQDYLTTVRSYYTAIRKECKDSITQHYTVSSSEPNYTIPLTSRYVTKVPVFYRLLCTDVPYSGYTFSRKCL